MPKALIVEDEPEANELLAMLVRLRGYETVSAFTGLEAIERALPTRPDVVFLDLMLPDISGYEVCRQLKSRRETSGYPVVMVTARLADENRIQGFREGVVEYVAKPYTPDQIFAAMSEADDWRSRLLHAGREGTIPIRSGSEPIHLREISKLWSLLLDRTSLSEDAARAINRSLVEISSRAVEWGFRSAQDLVATIDFHLDRERIGVTITDRSGWFLADPPGLDEGFGRLSTHGPFSDVVYDPRHNHVILSCLF